MQCTRFCHEKEFLQLRRPCPKVNRVHCECLTDSNPSDVYIYVYVVSQRKARPRTCGCQKLNWISNLMKVVIYRIRGVLYELDRGHWAVSSGITNLYTTF